MFRSLSQQPIPSTATTTTINTNSSAPPRRNSHMSQSRTRSHSTHHSQTLSSIPDPHKSKSRPTGFLTSFFATFTPSGSSGSPDGTSRNLKTHRSEVELRRDYLSPEREKEIGEIWETFKRQSQDIGEDKLTSFPCISEYEYEDQEDEEIHRRRVVA